MYFLMMYLKTY